MIVKAADLEPGAHDVSQLFECVFCRSWFPESSRDRHVTRCKGQGAAEALQSALAAYEPPTRRGFRIPNRGPKRNKFCRNGRK